MQTAWRYTLLIFLEPLVQMREGVEDVFRQVPPGRPLESVNAIQQTPEVERGRVENVGIAENVDEARLREQFQEQGNAADMRRRLENQSPAAVDERPLPRQAEKSGLPTPPRARRQAAKIEQIGVVLRPVGEGETLIGRRLTEQAQGEFILLRPIPTGEDVVHRPASRHQPV